MRRVDISQPELTHDPRRPAGFRAGVFRLGPLVGARDSGTSVYELPAGEALYPYHYEYGEEEWMLVLDGRATVRTPEGIEQVGPSEVVFFPKGPEGAHQVRNETADPLRLLMWSTVVLPTATAYPDSDKVAVWTGDDAEDLIAQRSSAVPYYHGEGGAPGA